MRESRDAATCSLGTHETSCVQERSAVSHKDRQPRGPFYFFSGNGGLVDEGDDADGRACALAPPEKQCALSSVSKHILVAPR